MLCQSYYQPKTIQEVIETLRDLNGGARIIAGGTDLIPDLRSRNKASGALVDISQIAGLNEIRMNHNQIYMGAMVTHTQALKSDLILKWAPALAEACATIGSPQIRNMGTLAGNIVNAMPAADAASALIALGASATILNTDQQERSMSVEQLYKGPGQSAVDSTREMVTALKFPVPNARSGSSFQRLSRRRALSLPVLNEAIFVCLDRDLKRFEDVRIVIGPVSPLPFRARNAENLLRGSIVTREIVKKATLVASGETSPRTSLRGGKEYRQQMVSVLMERGMGQALMRIDPMFSNFII